MRRLILKISVSLDGLIGGPNGEINWIFPSLGPDAKAWLVDTLAQAGAMLVGSRTFQDMAAYWPSSTDPIADPMNRTPKIVFSRTGLSLAEPNRTTQALNDARAESGAMLGAENKSEVLNETWRNPTIITGDLTTEISKLKQQSGRDLLAHGGARFVRSLVQHDLIDEYRLLVHPVVLGRGLPLFVDTPAPRRLKLVSATPFAAGAIASVYQPA